MKILIIEDEPDLRETIQKFLLGERYIVETAATMNEGLDKVLVYDYDCILLDIMLPDGNGLTLLKELKKRGKTENLIIISAKDAIEDKVQGIELGADDYLTKPFHLLELNARIKGLIRRKTAHGAMEIKLGNVSLVPDRFEVAVKGHPLELKRKEYDILYHLMTRPNRLVDKAALAEAVWGDYIDQADNYDFVYAQIKNLRKQMNDAGATIEIKSVYGFGYKLIERLPHRRLCVSLTIFTTMRWCT
ncbi:response regulator receiver domain protein [Porphyromonas gingivalis W4087]|uniref:Response regulator receiver domain protein n=2 Tax=Porphyromonas gingivalis TaxID=837 RepID=A0A0E2M586_PORGN|nr:response regulator transcription factor [Porphyromonas gingivalis]ALJ25192.1 response regulator with CheY-like receiver domain and winged-helix DNA-binding domain [Porphyromonas gingivalis 381]AUR50104.1 transcriptional regulatory protein response regulator [Porphyromonas gingivalis ATCC 33277]ERJ66121.1 response regulator receiver domain protein [Porphyromonas gingivalis F0570]ERJ69303.1 response regulator receiver domain protein [Porphyromonas gingivalis F0569]ERJ83573.1 response regulato